MEFRREDERLASSPGDPARPERAPERPPAAAGGQDPDPPEALLAALKARRYRWIDVLGRGAFGEVHLAVLEGDLGFKKAFAIKVFRPQHASTQAMELSRSLFIREARILAELRHDHIVEVVDFFDASPYLCLVMEYVEGPVLAAVLDHRRASGRGPVHLVTALAMAAQAARGLHYANSSRNRGPAQGLLHRDIKPGNLILSPRGRVQLLDFGIAGTMQERGADGEHLILGTPQYMSPEQARGEPMTPSSDLYSLGLVLYELLTLKKLITATSPRLALQQAAGLDAGPALVDLEHGHPGAAELLRWMLARDPAARPANGLELALKIDALSRRQPRPADLTRFYQNECTLIRQSAPGVLRRPLTELMASLPATMTVQTARLHALIDETPTGPSTGTVASPVDGTAPRPDRRKIAAGVLAGLALATTAALYLGRPSPSPVTGSGNLADVRTAPPATTPAPIDPPGHPEAAPEPAALKPASSPPSMTGGQAPQPPVGPRGGSGTSGQVTSRSPVSPATNVAASTPLPPPAAAPPPGAAGSPAPEPAPATRGRSGNIGTGASAHTAPCVDRLGRAGEDRATLRVVGNLSQIMRIDVLCQGEKLNPASGPFSQFELLPGRYTVVGVAAEGETGGFRSTVQINGPGVCTLSAGTTSVTCP